MAFHLFKKKNYADALIRGGKIYTLDPEYPEAQALAVKNGRVMASGSEEELEELIGPQTQITDLEGGYAVPGLTALFEHPSEDCVGSTFLTLADPMVTDEELCAQIAAYRDQHPDADCCLVLGIAESKLVRKEEDAEVLPLRAALDAAFPDYPVVVCSENGLSMVVDTAGADLVSARAEEDGVLTITPNFIIDTLVSVDYENSTRLMFEKSFELAGKGITSVYSSQRYSFIEKMYQGLQIDAHQADLIKQRYYGSFSLQRTLPSNSVIYSMERTRTSCLELDGLVNFSGLEILFSDDEASEKYMSGDYVRQLASDAADKGYNVRFYPVGKQAALSAIDIAGNLSSAYRKLSFMVIHGEELSDEELSGVYTGDAFIFDSKAPLPEKSGEEGITQACEMGARYLGLAEEAGTLEIGKRADLAVFAEDPAAEGVLLSSLKAEKTIVAGKLVYDRSCDSSQAWAGALAAYMQSETEELFEETEA